MNINTKDITLFLEFDEVVDLNPAITETAKKVSASFGSTEDKAKALFQWVRDEIAHTKDINAEEVTCSASDVLEYESGTCYAKSHLLASMMRSQNIPCGFCYQVFENSTSAVPDSLALHGLNGVYIDSIDKWIRIDPRGNKPGISAQFSLTDEILAFPNYEFLDDNIYPKPLSSVIEALTKYNSRTALWPNLPSVRI